MKLNIGLIDVDGHNYPNLALMKISAWHKAQGDYVEWANPMFQHYDIVYKSKVFTFTPDNQDVYDCTIIKGGTGYDPTIKLSQVIDDMQPDYSIYNITNLEKRKDKSKEKGDSQYRAVSAYGYREHVFDFTFKSARRRAHKHYPRRHRYYNDYISRDKIGYIAYVSKPYVYARRLGESEQPPHVETRRDCYHNRLHDFLLVFRRHNFLPLSVLRLYINYT